MIDKKQAMEIAAVETKKLFGLDYLKKNKEDLCISYWDSDNIFHVFVGVEAKRNRKNLKDKNGWVSYCEIQILLENGAHTVSEFAFPKSLRKTA